MTKLRLFVALLALVMLTSACSGSPTAPTPVATQPGPPVGPSIQPVSKSRRFENMRPMEGLGELFTRTSGPAKVMLFVNDEGIYNLTATIYVYEGSGGYGPKLGEATIAFSGKQGQAEIEYDSSRCVYKSLATSEIQCIAVVRNIDPLNTISGGILRIDGIPMR